MLPFVSLPMPVTWRDLLEELAPEFRRRSTHALFMALACGMILAGGRRPAHGRRARRGGGDSPAVAAGLLVLLPRILGH